MHPRLVLLLGALAACAAALGGCRANAANSVEGAAAELVAAGVPGVTVVISGPEGTRTIVEGMADPAAGTPLTADHHFPIGGLTTSYVAAAMLHMEESGDIALGDAVEDHLPGRFSYGWDIALWDLLQHTSGIPDYTDVGDGNGVVLDACLVSDLCMWTPQELTALVAGEPPVFGPGEGWGYANTNYTVAGEILETVSGETWQSVVTERLLAPLGLSDTSFGDRQADMVPVGHVDRGDDDVETVSKLVPGGFGPEGAIVASASDVMGFFRPLLRGDVLSEAGQIALTATAPTSFGHEDYGLGVSFVFGFDEPQIGNTGEAYGYSAFVEHNRETDVTTVILVNQSGNLPSEQWGALLSAATDVPGRAVQTRAADSGPGQLRLYCTIDPSLFERDDEGGA